MVLFVYPNQEGFIFIMVDSPSVWPISACLGRLQESGQKYSIEHTFFVDDKKTNIKLPEHLKKRQLSHHDNSMEAIETDLFLDKIL